MVSGGNLVLPGGVISLEVPEVFDVSVLVTGDDGRVSGDGDFVFYNQPSAPGVRLDGGGRVLLEPWRVRPGASRLTVVVSPAEPGAALAGLPAPRLVVRAGGVSVAGFTVPRVGRETVLLLGEVYRRGGSWKLRALGQGYADGLAGLARDFGVEVVDDGAPVADPDGYAALVNSARGRVGVPGVSLDGRLVSAALAHAEGMAAVGALSSEGADGTSVFERVGRAGYSYLSIGEHILYGPRTPDEFVRYCLEDARGRQVLLDRRVVDFGVARVVSRSGVVYWTALWCRPFSDEGLREFTDEVVALTNAERGAFGLRALVPDVRLAAAAQAHSADMVARRFYSHTSPDGREPWDRAAAAGCGHRGIGENIACGQRSPAEVVQGWMNSPGHRANILKPEFTHIGVGFVGGGQAGTYWTQLFGMS
ncbi:MAG TPA: CAP domain-containing protein [Thermomonospora sp.]|nr:CAP domain-containing protein [Thermomonospora sp.]